MRLLLILFLLATLAACATTHSQAVEPTPMPTLSPEARGQTLFVNKGCITCHEHSRLNYQGLTIGEGPPLTNYQNSPELLKAWLRNPSAVRPGTAMPTLPLSEAEIDALITFINQPR